MIENYQDELKKQSAVAKQSEGSSYGRRKDSLRKGKKQANEEVSQAASSE